MPRESDSKQRMIKAMGRLMQRQGYYATGLNEVVSASGSPKGSMYFHFPGGKEQLAAESIAVSGARLRGMIESIVANAPTAADAILALARGMAAGLVGSNYTEGCPIATVALEVSSTSEAIRTTSDEVFRSWEAAIAKRLVDLGWPAEDARSFSVVALAALEGGLLLSRTSQDVTPLLEVGKHLARLADATRRSSD
jgi:TetR/AcrR family transcriptional regulator, lmrAB and yxaGH operons repressor